MVKNIFRMNYCLVFVLLVICFSSCFFLLILTFNNWYFRLEAYDRNQDFGGQDNTGEDYFMEIPHSTLYKDINSETVFVEFKIGAIEAYLNALNKYMDLNA